VEGALKLARLATGRTDIVSADDSFHGKTFGALSASGRERYRQPFEPLLPGFRRVSFGDAGALDAAVDEHTAAVILEPVQGEGGMVLPPSDYLGSAAEICRTRGALLILDEVQTGLGRTGRLFACEHWGVIPDLLVLAKALGGGVMPIGAIIGTPQVWAPLSHQPLIHTSTFGGNPLACAAALAALTVLIEERLPERAAEMGELLIGRLRGIAADYPEVISDVRGLGLMIGVELREEGYGGSVIQEMVRQNIITSYTLNQPRVIRFEPPLTITEELVEVAVDAFRRAVARTAELLPALSVKES
jgi:putrescine aminotransferase